MFGAARTEVPFPLATGFTLIEVIFILAGALFVAAASGKSDCVYTNLPAVTFGTAAVGQLRRKVTHTHH